MEFISAFSYGAAAAATALSVAVALSGKRTVARGCFVAGMWLLATRSILAGMAAGAADGADWVRAAVLVDSLLPAVWIAFSLSYSRADHPLPLRKAGVLLAAALVVPVGLAVAMQFGPGSSGDASGGARMSYGRPAYGLEAVILAACIVVAANLERTLRAAAGTERWRIQYVFIGLSMILGARIYTAAQAILHGGRLPELSVVESVALLTGCLLMVVAWARRGFSAVAIYPSGRLVEGSATVLLAGAYLLVLCGVARLAERIGGSADFALQTVVVTGGLAVLMVLLLSRRVKRRIRTLVSRHLLRPQYDSRAVWTTFTKRLPVAAGEDGYSREAVRLIAETFQVLSVSLWQPDVTGTTLVCRAVTNGSADPDGSAGEADLTDGAAAILAAIREREAPFDLELERGPWADALRRLHESLFQNGGNRLCVPLRSGDSTVGLLILADRVGGAPYSPEELDLLRCCAGQIAAGLLRHRLTAELMQARELEAFQAMSTFFIHDLKNAAASLELTLANLPLHFDKAEFREDALRVLRTTAGRIRRITSSLSSLRNHLDLNLEQADLNALVRECLQELRMPGEVEIDEKLRPLPPVLADRSQIGTVVTNLLLNAREAVHAGGRITVETALLDGRAVLSVADNGRGMSPHFVKESLFRPFRSTRKSGLGIGMYQSRMIVEAHRGTMAVRSREGKGTTFRISLPAQKEPA